MARMKHGVFSWEDVLAQRYQSNKPAPLQHRYRTISTPESPAQQPQCRLLSLSPELRMIIWGYALSHLRLHIIQRSPQRLGYIICPLSATGIPDKAAHAGSPFCEICQGGGIPPARKGSRSSSGGTRCEWNQASCAVIDMPTNVQSLESTHLLYTLNTFEFSNPWTLPYFRPTLPLDSWEAIRSVELRWAFPGHWLPTKDPVRAVYVAAGRAQWLETCRTLNRLPSLRSFVLVLGNNWFSEPVEKLPIFLEPLRGLRVQHQRHCGWSDGPLSLKPGLRKDSSFPSGEELGLISITHGSESSLRSSPASSSSCVRPLVSAEVGSDIPAPLGPLPSWELRLQGQSYYLHEMGRAGEDLRRRGIDCVISMV
ncbi:hypothetical protein N7481_003931 [Penicillium waksmanii]|uniref:uncharacterized protein n=1 Tax=Penicillium waksmanii TaxID=69791 RepID=UPI002548ACD9|nr:uncharacterized protein N7481_003931 [Penicillium waksmanii]KAJ5988721.1 hypothetical protein N7481_003931 [Penicillium waksmanii]